jgi:four helix bundle protein
VLRDFRELNVWKKAYRLTLDIYQATRCFPKEELYGLTSQLRRSAASIPANIAEGCGRSSNGELSRFFQIAMGSASELEFHLLLCRDIGLLSADKHNQLSQQTVEVKRMLTSYWQKLKGPGRNLTADI